MIATLLTSLALAASLIGMSAPTAPTANEEARPIPKLTADRWIVYDADAEVVLASWNADEQASMASVTKVITAMVVIDNTDLSDIVTIPEFVTNTRGSTAGLVAGEEWTVGDLLIAMLVRSGNDAALTLGYSVGGESIDAFVAMMNAKADDLGLENTKFANPNGLDNENHYSSARDLLSVIIASQDYPDLQRVARIRVVTMPEDPDGEARTFTNTNKLLGAYPGTLGLKTGETPWADKVLLGVTEQAGRTIYSVVMGSDDHFSDTREIVDWAFSTYSVNDRWLRPLYSQQGGGAVTGSPEITDGHQRRLSAMLPLDDGRWNTSTLEDLPKAATIGRWIRGAIPEIAGGDG
jgi:serine-type D-Ala-D-Ala carboxypeptidase (penicillin-binding protein 5/6)